MKGFVYSFFLLLLLLMGISKSISAKSFVETIASSINKASEIIDSYLNPNDTELNEEISKEVEKRKTLHDQFSSAVLKESSIISKIHGVLDKHFDKFTKKFLKIFPEDKHSVIEEHLKSIRNSEDDDWKFFSIIYTNDNSNTVQYFSLYGNHAGEKSNVYYINFESNFRMPISNRENNDKDSDNDLLAIISTSSTTDEIEEIKSIPTGMNPIDVRMLLSIVKKKTMKEFEKSLPKSSTDHFAKDEM